MALVLKEKTLKSIEIVAELAQGFEGDLRQGQLLVKAAAKSGADIAKLQLVYADELATPDYEYYDLFKGLEMPDDAWATLVRDANDQNVQIEFDVFGSKSLKLAADLGCPSVKLHGTDISNLGFLEEVNASSVQTVALGAGGAHRSEIDTALDKLSGKNVVIMLGFQGYPTPDPSNQISRVRSLVDAFSNQSGRISIGFADHAAPESSLRYALAATALGAGARVIEKHLTLGKVMEMEDHESALNPDEFAEFCETIRGCAAAFGKTSDADDFDMSDPEISYRNMIRRHVVSSRKLDAGTKLDAEDLVLKRTSVSHPLTDLQDVYGRQLSSAVAANSAVTKDSLQ